MSDRNGKTPSAPLMLMGRVGDILEGLSILVGATFLIGFFAAVVLDVVARTANNSLTWTQDAAIFAYVWCIFTTSAVCVRRNEHFSIELFSRLPKAVKLIQRLFILAILFVFAYYMIVYGWEYARLGLTRKSSSSGFPLFYAIVCIPLSSVAMTYFLIEQLVCFILGVDLSQISKKMAKKADEKDG